MTYWCVVLKAGDLSLRVLDPYADCKGFLLK